ncbi:MAG TPA: molecular chaperone TorD family protein [Vicinamibacteria bacterium]|nr:molecular chaperone TorD family protein [Vicinamibacteria bacterium]
MFVDLVPPDAPPEILLRDYPLTAEALAALAAALRRAPAADIASDRVRLFVNAMGGVAAPPYASWYLDGTLAGPAAVQAAEAYAAQCLEAAGDSGHPPDYLGTELEFLNLLCRHQVAAQATGDAAAGTAAGQAEASFLLGHFCRWVPHFAKAMRGAAPGPVFGRLAGALEALCAEEQRRLTGALPTRCAPPAAGAMDRSAHTGHSDAGGRSWPPPFHTTTR